MHDVPPPLYSRWAADPVLAEMVVLFVSEMPHRVESLRGQLLAQEWDALKRAAHQLKGAAGSYGFDDLTPHAARLEKAVAEGQGVEEITQAYKVLAAQCSRVTAEKPLQQQSPAAH